MLNAVLKTLPLAENVPTLGAICMIFDTMGVLPVTRQKNKLKTMKY
jgi:hypothetical protein